MRREELEEITKAIEASAEKGVGKALISLGVDVGNPLEVQKDLAFVRRQRQASEQVTKLARRTIISLVIVGSLGVFWAGLKDAIFK
ncbi:MAG: hypothetical protein V7785_07955 [Bermanella sp.]